MALSKIKTPLLAVVVALMARLTSGAPSIPMDLCANINTATSDPSKLTRGYGSMLLLTPMTFESFRYMAIRWSLP